MADGAVYDAAQVLAPTGARHALARLTLGGVAVSCCFLTIFAMAMKPVDDPDFWWHLATGRYMATTQLIPHHDIFSLTMRGHAWITHEWVTELLFYGGWNLGGFRLLMLATACTITLTFGIVYVTARERGAPVYLSAAIVLLAALASAHTWGTRPQMISLLLMALFGLGITRMIVRRLPAPPLWMAAMMVPWVNIHGGFIFGLALLFIATGSYVIADHLRWAKTRALPSGDGPAAWGTRPAASISRCCRTLALAATATLINPNGLAGALYPLSYLGNNASTRYIAEWVSPDFHQAQYLIFEALVLLLLVVALAAPSRARFTDVAALLPFLYLALQSVRNISLFAVLAAPVIAEIAVAALPEQYRHARALKPPPQGKATINLIVVAAIAIMIGVSSAGKLSDTSEEHAVATMYPAGALHYMNKHSVPSRGFDYYNWGGYLIWNWYPKHFVFVDGRPDMYGDTFMDRYIQAWEGKDSWRALFASNRLCYALIEPDAGIVAVLRHTAGWSLVYHDTVSQLFIASHKVSGCG
jgi:hypothetical protein